MNHRDRRVSVALALAVSTLALAPAPQANAAESQCWNAGATGCMWVDITYSGSFKGLMSTFTGYCQLQSLDGWNNVVSSYRNNSTSKQYMWTGQYFTGSSQTFSQQQSYSTVTYNDNYESWKGYCTAL